MQYLFSLKKYINFNTFFIIVLIISLFIHAALINSVSVFAKADSISNSVVRFRILANSDTEKDQDIKLKFKTLFCEWMKTQLKNCDSKREVFDYINTNKSSIEKKSNEILYDISTNKNNTCSVSLSKNLFPTRQYGHFTFPPGNYDTLLITIGKGKGHNWWCVLYPSLCFTDEYSSDFPKESDNKLKSTLSNEDYSSIKQGVTLKFKIAEIISNFCNRK